MSETIKAATSSLSTETRQPNFLVIGERRSGTTTLARWMQAHPGIFLHPHMDIGYFIDKELVGRMEWLEGAVDYDRWGEEHSKAAYIDKFREASEAQSAIGEKSADYFFWTHSHQRIKEYFPDIKLLITLRNPVERAWSMYWNERGKGREQLSFEEAIEAEQGRIEKSDYARNHLSYVSRGFYDESLERLYRTFAPEQVYVLILEESRREPQKYMKEVYNFLEVDDAQGFDNVEKQFNRNWATVPREIFKKYPALGALEAKYFWLISKVSRRLYRKNVYKRRRMMLLLSKPFRKSKESFKMKEATRAKLQALYRPHIQKLEQMLGKDLSVWLQD